MRVKKEVVEDRKNALELLLSNHNQNCLACPKNLKCDFQKLCEKFDNIELTVIGSGRQKLEKLSSKERIIFVKIVENTAVLNPLNVQYMKNAIKIITNYFIFFWKFLKTSDIIHTSKGGIFMKNELLLLAGSDIPFPEARITIHQPTLKEIGYIYLNKDFKGSSYPLPDEELQYFFKFATSVNFPKLKQEVRLSRILWSTVLN